MKNKKGFTLIELLAVIVILAIIALIATPMIMDVIDKARKGAVENSALGYVEGVEKYAVYGMIDNGGYVSVNAGVYFVGDPNINAGETGGPYTNILNEVEYKGDLPEAGWVAIDEKGNVTAAFLKFKSYASYIGYTNSKHAQAIFSKADYDSVSVTKTTDVNELEETMNGKLK